MYVTLSPVPVGHLWGVDGSVSCGVQCLRTVPSQRGAGSQCKTCFKPSDLKQTTKISRYAQTVILQVIDISASALWRTQGHEVFALYAVKGITPFSSNLTINYLTNRPFTPRSYVISLRFDLHTAIMKISY